MREVSVVLEVLEVPFERGRYFRSIVRGGSERGAQEERCFSRGGCLMGREAGTSRPGMKNIKCNDMQVAGMVMPGVFEYRSAFRLWHTACRAAKQRAALVVGRVCLPSQALRCSAISSAKPPGCEDVRTPWRVAAR